MGFNAFVSTILKSPLHGLMSGSTMLITVTGRKSGQPITTPVNYAQSGDTVLVTSRAERKWWRNLIGGAPVSMVLRGQTICGTARAFAGSDATGVQAFKRFFAERPAWASRFGIRCNQDGGFNADDLNRVMHECVIVEIALRNQEESDEQQ